MSDSLRPHWLQQARLLCPSLSPWVCSNSYPLSQLCHPTISSSVAPFSSCPQFFPASGSFSMSQFFTSGGQSIRASASASIFPMNIQDWSLCSPRDSQESPPTSQFKSINLQRSTFFIVQLPHPYMTTGKTIALTIWIFVKVMSLLFDTLSRFVIAILPRSKCLNFVAAVTICIDFGAQENEIWHGFHIFPIYLPWSDRTGCHDLSFLRADSQ